MTGIFELWRLGVVELGVALARRELSPVGALESCLARIERLNPTLNAVVTLNRTALEEARASERRHRQGEVKGPLDGVPITVKDNLFAAGMPATWGSRLFANFVPAEDERPVARLRAAGAVVVGKTNVPEFTLDGYTSNALFDTTGNPWNPRLTPGGSSGGAVASVAAGMVPAAIGTDGGGSIRRPAGHTGLVGLKPTIGRIPRHGGFPHVLLDFKVAGPLSRSVADAALLFEAMAAPDPRVDNSHGFGRPSVELKRPPGRLRILYVERFGDAPLDPVIARSVARAADALAALGHEVKTGPLPFDLEPITAFWPVIGQVGLAHLLELHADRRGLVGETYLRMAEAGRQVPAARYLAGLETVRGFRADVAGIFERIDVILTPSAAAQPWLANQPFPPEIDGQSVGPRGHAVYTGWVNACGHPAIALPADPAPDGMPIGFQLIGRFGADELLLRLARQYEQARPWADRWPALALSR
ncbi:MAG TPA: amidase [Geminicoccaceae bacterium]|nr:amidase [Geminicoccaceae bacterium]